MKLSEGSGYEFEIFEQNIHRFLKMNTLEQNGFDIEFSSRSDLDYNSKISSKTTFIEDGQNVLQTLSERSEKNAESITKKILLGSVINISVHFFRLRNFIRNF